MTRAKCLERVADAFDSLLDNAAEDEEQRARSHGLLSEAMGLDASDVETYRLMEMAATLITEYKLALVGTANGGTVEAFEDWLAFHHALGGCARELEQLTARISAIEKTQSDFFDQIDHIGDRIRTATSDHDLAEESFGDMPGSGDWSTRWLAHRQRSKI